MASEEEWGRPGEYDEEPDRKPDYAFDLDQILTTNKLSEMHQEGNYLVITTETGLKFRHRIAPNKILEFKDGKYILRDMVHSD